MNALTIDHPRRFLRALAVAVIALAVFAVAAAVVSAVFLRTAVSVPAHESEQAVGTPAAAEAC